MFPAFGICSSVRVVSLKTSGKVAVRLRLHRRAVGAVPVAVVAAAANQLTLRLIIFASAPSFTHSRAHQVSHASNLTDERALDSHDLKVDCAQSFCDILFVRDQIVEIRDCAERVV